METSALRRPHAVGLPRSRRLLAAFGDDRLVEQVRRGNEAAFEVIYDRHHRGILAFCRHMLGSRDEAEDAVQQTFTSAYTDLQSNERDIRLKAWLYTIARNRCLSMLRARREQPAELDEQATAGLSEEVQRRADLRDLLHDLGDLPDDQREALVLFEVGDLSQAEVARVIGVEPVKVKALVFQARSSLIEKREARAIPCTEIREQLATATGGALRRGPLRRHLKVCEGCSEYRDQVRDQRSALALILPVVPSVGLKDAVLGAIGFGGGAGGAGVATGGAAGGAVGSGALGGASAGGGGLFAAIAGTGGIKLAVAATIAGGALAGGVAFERSVQDSGPSQAEAEASDTSEASSSSAAGGSGPGSSGAAPVAGGNETSDGGARDGDDAKGNEDGKRDAEGDEGNRGDDKRSDGDARSENGGSKGHARRGGKSRGRGAGSRRGSRRGGKGRARGRRSGTTIRKTPRPPKPPPTTNSEPDSTSDGSGTTADREDRNGDKAPEVPATDSVTGDDSADVERLADEQKRLLTDATLP